MSASSVYDLLKCHKIRQSKGDRKYLEGVRCGVETCGSRGVEASVCRVRTFQHREDINIDEADQHHQSHHRRHGVARSSDISDGQHTLLPRLLSWWSQDGTH